MKRPAHQEKTAMRIKKWREICPDLAIRSTFIVGFPGEMEEDFQMLLDWLDEVELDHVGCFKYEDVEGAKSHELENHVSEEVKEERWHRFMQKQQEISARRLQKKIGQTLEVLVDEIGQTEDGERVAVGHTRYAAPEIDGTVTVNLVDREDIVSGSIIKAEITDADEYDLYGIIA